MEEMSQDDGLDRKDGIMFFSFIQSSRHCRSNDSGIGDKNSSSYYTDEDGVVVIDEDEEVEEPDLELLCEIEFDTGKALPLPIEQKLICKTEPESIQETGRHCAQLKGNQLSINFIENDDELMPLFKLQQDEDLGGIVACDTSDFKSNQYINFICPQCGIAFGAVGPWREHIEQMHNLSDQRNFNFTQRPNNEFECNKCQAVITRCTIRTLQQHRFTHLPHKVYKCKLCMYEERSLYLMISHIMLHKDREELDNVVPPKRSDATPQKVALEHQSSLLMSYICPSCGITFDTEDLWQAHINFRHNFLEKAAENRYEDHFKCSECGVEIFSQHISDLQQHLITHLPFKSYLKCKLCSWSISRRNFMVLHMLNLHKSELSTAAAEAAANAVNSNNSLSFNDSSGTELRPVALTHLSYANLESARSDSRSTSLATTPLPVTVDSVTETRTKNSAAIAADTTTSRPKRSQTHASNKYNITLERSSGFKCSGCACFFPDAATRNAHNVVEHAKYKCNGCNENFAIKADLKRHKCLREAMQCDICFREYNYEKCFLNHMRRCRANAIRKLPRPFTL